MFERFKKLYKKDPKKKPGITLVLGSGGIKGISHVGVLRTLEEANIKIDRIVGCSIGALVAAFYADRLNAEEVLGIAFDLIPKNYSYSTFGRPSLQKGFRGKGFFTMYKLEKMLEGHLKARTFDALNLPILVLATNLVNGRLASFAEGPLIPPLCASAAIPGIFQPIEIAGNHYVDGAVSTALPVQLAKETGGERVVAVNLLSTLKEEPNVHLHSVIGRSYHIMRDLSQKEEQNLADVVLNPDVEDKGMLFASREDMQGLYDAGRREAERKLPMIEALLA